MDSDIRKKCINLCANKLWIDGGNIRHRLGILCCQGRDDRTSVGAERTHCFDVSQDARSARGIHPRNGECIGNQTRRLGGAHVLLLGVIKPVVGELGAAW